MYKKAIIAAAFCSLVLGVAAIAAGPPTPGSWYRAGLVSFGSGVHFTDITTSITALAGGGQSATATSGLSLVNQVTTVASANDSITLPAPVAPYGRNRFIGNSASTNALKIYVVTPGTINGLATATGYTLAAGKATRCIDVSATDVLCAGP